MINFKKLLFMDKPVQIICSKTMLRWGKNLENLSLILCHSPSCFLVTGSISYSLLFFNRRQYFRKKIIRYMAKHQEQFWIVKPPNLFCGMGIRVVNKFLDIPNKKSQLCVQNYIRKIEITWHFKATSWYLNKEWVIIIKQVIIYETQESFSH